MAVQKPRPPLCACLSGQPVLLPASALPFPAGPHLEKVSESFVGKTKPFRISVTDLWCNLSGGMNMAEKRWQEIDTDQAEVLIVSYGTPARISLSAAEILKSQGIKAGLFRPITLWPFPMTELREAIMRPNIKAVLCVEMSLGQLIEDVRYAALDKKPVAFLGKAGGIIPTQFEIAEAAKAALGR